MNSGFGIFTSISGTAPNRIFNIEWRAQYFPGSGSAGFELRLYEGQLRFDVIYGTVSKGNTSATAGVQRDNTFFTQYFCNGSGGAATGGQSYVYFPPPCPTPTPSATPIQQLHSRQRLRQRPLQLPRLQRLATFTPTPTPIGSAPPTSNTNRYCYRDCDGYFYGYANIDAYGYFYCDRDSYTAAYSVTKGYSATKASADSRAAWLSGVSES